MDKTRIRYAKTGKAKYISHLDLVALMPRALARAGASLKYSEGFNPHPYISVALPLPVGAESICELMDVALQSSVPNEIGAYLPEGIEFEKTYRSARSFRDIKWLEIECRLSFPLAFTKTQEISDILTDRFASTNLVVSKKTKRGLSTFDLVPYIKNVTVDADGCGVTIKAKISAQNPTISHRDILATVEDALIAGDIVNDIKYIRLKRIEIYDGNMLLFR